MPSYRNAFDCPDDVVKRCAQDRQSLMRRELEDYLVEQCRQSPADATTWALQYGSAAEYENSCTPHRERWSRTVGEFRFDAPFRPRYEPFFENERWLARWLFIDLDDERLTARAVLATPKEHEKPLPLVIAQHGIGSSPEKAFGFGDAPGLYHGYGRALLDAGYAVLAPSNITEAPPRARLQRLCLLLGRTLAGLEVGKIRRLLDFASELPEVDANRVGMWGISLGGMYTMYTAALERRIRAAIICAFFNDRLAKMAVSSRLYSCFLDVNEEHIWLPGWLSGGFDDAALMALICPRAVQVQQGRADGIGWWPLQHAAFARGKTPYEKLNIAARANYADHEGGHEILVEEGLAFLEEQL